MLAAVALAACRDRPDPVDLGNAPVTGPRIDVPTSIKKTIRYRCEGGGRIAVDFFDDDRTIYLRTDAGLAELKAAIPGGPFRDGRWTVAVDSGGVRMTGSGAKAMNCE